MDFLTTIGTGLNGWINLAHFAPRVPFKTASEKFQLEAPFSGAIEARVPHPALVEPFGLLDLPHDILHRIMERFKTLPRSEWPGLMYSCTFWNDVLIEPFLQDVGLVRPSNSSDSASQTTLVLEYDIFVRLGYA
ncbi:hypothetical protein SCHPADRAFT_896821 [Schizopora paradoxa]|uniref:F-box domain-containing protein n=1 Tax=Schizopora paradoxa TaxID=27342 RepID=A0A0H2RIP2_9AGAM|nr:hypothetical protein SCHPADRAFT_896821 [Schizopora paradoxa]